VTLETPHQSKVLCDNWF